MSNLLVQNIKHTNNTTALSVDSSGRVTEPNKPSWHVYFKTGGGGTGKTGVLVFNTAHKNVGTMCNLSTGIVTVPVTGTYHIYATLLGTNSTGGAMSEDLVAYIDIDTGGGFISLAKVFSDYSIHGNGNGYTSSFLHLTYPLVATNQIRINVTGGHTYVENADYPYTSFGGYLIG